MAEPKVIVKVEPVDNIQETIKVDVPAPSDTPLPDGIITTKRKTPIKRYNAVPLTETHGMTTEADRFRET